MRPSSAWPRRRSSVRWASVRKRSGSSGMGSAPRVSSSVVRVAAVLGARAKAAHALARRDCHSVAAARHRSTSARCAGVSSSSDRGSGHRLGQRHRLGPAGERVGREEGEHARVPVLGDQPRCDREPEARCGDERPELHRLPLLDAPAHSLRRPGPGHPCAERGTWLDAGREPLGVSHPLHLAGPSEPGHGGADAGLETDDVGRAGAEQGEQEERHRPRTVPARGR